MEAYPAAALRLWSTGDGRPLAWAGYKTEATSRATLLEQLAEIVDLEHDGAAGHVEQMIASDDALDAMLCALIATAVARGQTFSVDAPVRAGDLVPPSTRVPIRSRHSRGAPRPSRGAAPVRHRARAPRGLDPRAPASAAA